MFMSMIRQLTRLSLSIGFVALLSGCCCVCDRKNDSAKTEEKQSMRDLFIFFGPPACGKGTLAASLKDVLKFITISTGDVLRQNVGQGTELGKKAQPIMARGELVTDDLINAMMSDWLTKQAGGTSAIILDGYPRTTGQAQVLLDMLKDPKNASFRLRIVRFSVSEAEAVDRIVYRVVCGNKACQKVYSLKSLKPKVDGVCDLCGGQLSKRGDDTEEVIKKRYNDYMKTESDMLNFFKQHNVEIQEISAEQPMENVFEAFKKLL
jgi:adenylate kinase